MDPRDERLGWVTRAEWGVCVGGTVVAVVLHLVLLTHAGGLWRDEVSTVQLASFPTMGEMWRLLGRDSFPALFPLLLRIWSAVGLGGSDFSFRIVGLLVGLLILAALWLNAKVLGARMPIVSLALVAVNTTLLRWGDSLRATGLACALIIFTLTAVWWLILAPSPRRFLLAALAAILSVHCLYQNAFLLLAICCAAFIVCFRCQQNKTALWVLGVGAVAALSILPYAGIISESQRWYVVQQTGFDPEHILANLWIALGSPLWIQSLVWVAICLLALVLGLASLRTSARRKRVGFDQVPLYACLSLAFGIFCFVFFLVLARLPTQPWYLLPPIALVAACADVALIKLPVQFRPARLAIAALIIGLPLIPAIPELKPRQTSIDLVAAALNEKTRADDYVVVYPWFCGVTFTRYYHGPASWSTIPPLADTRIHRYDQLKDQLAANAPIQPVLDKISQTLAAGNRVWIVGQLPLLAPGQEDVAPLPPAPDGPWGWSDLPYIYTWGRETERLLSRTAGHIDRVALPSTQPINFYENIPLYVVTGVKFGSIVQ
jgi:hypothetical protein